MSDDSMKLMPQFRPGAQFFEDFAGRAEIIYWAADPETFQILYVSQFAAEVLGKPLAEWQRPSFWQDHLYAGDRERVLLLFETAVASQQPQDLEYRLQAADGSLVWFRDKVSLLTYGDQPLLCGMMTDVTSFKTAVGHHIGIPGYTSVFLEIVRLLSENKVIGQRLNQVAEKLCLVFDVTAVCILDWNAEWGIVTQLARFAIDGNSVLEKNDELTHQFTALINELNWQEHPFPTVSSVEDDDLPDWLQAYLQTHRAKTILHVPILASGKLIGCIELIEQREQRRFSVNDLELSQIIAQQVGIAVTRAQLFAAEARRRREAEILLDVAEFVSSSLDRDEILARVMEMLRVYLSDVHNLSISIIQEDDVTLETIFSWWADESYAMMPKGSKIGIDKTFTAQLALKGGEPVVITDLREIPFTNEFTARKIKEGLCSILCVPLKIHDRLLGTMHIHYWHQARKYSAEEIAVLQGVANQAAIAIENARLFANARRQLHLSQTLQKVGSLLTASLPLEVVYEQIFELLGQVIDFDSASLFLFDKSASQYELVASWGFDKSTFEAGQLVLSLESVQRKIDHEPGWAVIQNVKQNPNWVNREEFAFIRAWIGALLMVKGEKIGLLCVDSAVENRYSAEDGQTVAAFANQAAVAIENARLALETARQARELAVLNQVSQETAVSLNVDHFLEEVTRLVAEELYPNFFGFILQEPETGDLKPHGSYRGLSQAPQQLKIPNRTSIAGHVLQTGEPYYAANVAEDPYFFSVGTGVSSLVTVPLRVENEVVGVINVASPNIDDFSERDINFLMTLAGNISVVLERARLYESQRLQAERLAELVDKRTAELKIERDRLFAILESAGEGIILTDINARIMYANPAMERQSGYSRRELLNQNPRILGSDQVPAAVFSEMWKNLLRQKSWAGTLINQHKDGQMYDVALKITPISDAHGKVTGYVSVQSDISKLKELERLKTEFIANVSHQLRTPLTNIKTYVSLLSKGRPENFPRYFSVLHHEIDRLARLIQDLLDISRLDAEAAPNPEASADFCDVWDMFWPSFMERAERENRQLQISLPQQVRSQMPHVHMESYQLEKVLSRLVENGLMYTPEGGWVEVKVSWQGENREGLFLSVCDNGPGIREEERPFIFDRFFRGADVVEAGLPGNGLGLAIVQELLTQYGGHISLESDRDEGCCFTVFLPLARPKTEGKVVNAA